MKNTCGRIYFKQNHQNLSSTTVAKTNVCRVPFIHLTRERIYIPEVMIVEQGRGGVPLYINIRPPTWPFHDYIYMAHIEEFPLCISINHMPEPILYPLSSLMKLLSLVRYYFATTSYDHHFAFQCLLIIIDFLLSNTSRMGMYPTLNVVPQCLHQPMLLDPLFIIFKHLNFNRNTPLKPSSQPQI